MIRKKVKVFNPQPLTEELRKLIRSEFLKQRSNTDEIVSQIMKSETYLFEPRSFFPLIDKEYVAALYLANMK